MIFSFLRKINVGVADMCKILFKNCKIIIKKRKKKYWNGEWIEKIVEFSSFYLRTDLVSTVSTVSN